MIGNLCDMCQISSKQIIEGSAKESNIPQAITGFENLYENDPKQYTEKLIIYYQAWSSALSHLGF
jgi:hypothetical protein